MVQPTMSELKEQLKEAKDRLQDIQAEIDNYSYDYDGWQDDWIDHNYSSLRHDFVEELMEHGYSRTTAENCDDWRDEFVKEAWENK